jgi:hypothetical protein
MGCRMYQKALKNHQYLQIGFRMYQKVLENHLVLQATKKWRL